MTSCNRKERIVRLAQRHPDLSTLVSLLEPEFTLSKDFLDAYFRYCISYGKKSELLQSILGGDTADTSGEGGVVDFSTYVQVVRYFQAHPKRPLERLQTRFLREDIPHYIARRCGISRNPQRHFLSRLGLLPYMLYLRGRLPGQYHLISFPHDADMSFLRPFLVSRTLTEDVCQQFLSTSTKVTDYDVYFDTLCDPLNFRNILFYLRMFLRANRLGGRIQNKIPRTISNTLNIRRLSIPQLQVTLDILGLAYAGVIDIDRLDQDPLQIRHIISVLHDDKGIPDLKDTVEPFVSSWLMTTERAETFFMRRSRDQLEGIYESSMWFNAMRLLSKPRKSNAAFSGNFRRYYDLIDSDRFFRHVHSHFLLHDPSYADWLRSVRLAFPHQFTGIRIRDLSNTAYYLFHHLARGFAPEVSLPPVAQFTLGVKEPVATGSRPRRQRPAPSKAWRRKALGLPVLEEFESAARAPVRVRDNMQSGY